MDLHHALELSRHLQSSKPLLAIQDLDDRISIQPLFRS